ncbi:MAG: hypothetical protein ACPGUV_12850 [Polyangiales bacterium]
MLIGPEGRAQLRAAARISAALIEWVAGCAFGWWGSRALWRWAGHDLQQGFGAWVGWLGVAVFCGVGGYRFGKSVRLARAEVERPE